MSVFDNKLPETCDTCDGPFHTEWIGQSECRPCGRGSDIPRANAAIDTLTLDTSSALENCRDYAEDALEILKMGRMSAQRKVCECCAGIEPMPILHVHPESTSEDLQEFLGQRVCHECVVELVEG